MSKPVKWRILDCLPKEKLLTFSLPRYWRGSITRWSNSACYCSICSLLNICHVVAVVTMKECLSLFTSFKVLAVHAFTIFRTKNVCLETFTVLFETSRFLAMTSLIVLYKHQSFPSLFLQLFPTISYDGQQHQKKVGSHKKQKINKNTSNEF